MAKQKVSKRFKREAALEVKRLRGQRTTENKGELVRSLNDLKRSKSKIMAALDGVPVGHRSSRGLEKGTRMLINAIALIETAVKGL